MQICGYRNSNRNRNASLLSQQLRFSQLFARLLLTTYSQQAVESQRFLTIENTRSLSFKALLLVSLILPRNKVTAFQRQALHPQDRHAYIWTASSYVFDLKLALLVDE